ncbi:MAG: hypothetical protein O3B31_06520 [Chloroflexi bacterium]|nr:hypothetical protein [Chloroflexota bacterium]MDA1002987.1 hypothetical protein [Chloroflexota bacterium]
MSIQTEFPFTLPRGYLDETGALHRDGIMRLATARDEIEPLRDARVKENEAYLTVIVLSRTITTLGSVPRMTPKVVEGMFSSDLAYLQDFYTRINFGGAAEQEAVMAEAALPLAGAAAGG